MSRHDYLRAAVSLIFGAALIVSSLPHLTVEPQSDITKPATVEPIMATRPPEPIAAPEPSVEVEVVPEPPPQPTLTPAAVVTSSASGTKYEWMAAAGIPESDWWAVEFIVSREAGWNPCAYYPGRSNCALSSAQVNATRATGAACGLAQSYPCGKQEIYGHWTDPVANLKWQFAYVTNRYGGYPQAVEFWKRNHAY